MGDKKALDKLLQEAHSAVYARAPRLTDLEGWVAERDALLRESESEIKALLGQIATTKDEHAGEIERLVGHKNGLDNLLQEASGALEARAARIADLEGWVAERDALLRERDEQ